MQIFLGSFWRFPNIKEGVETDSDTITKGTGGTYSTKVTYNIKSIKYNQEKEQVQNYTAPVGSWTLDLEPTTNTSYNNSITCVIEKASKDGFYYNDVSIESTNRGALRSRVK